MKYLFLILVLVLILMSVICNCNGVVVDDCVDFFKIDKVVVCIEIY